MAIAAQVGTICRMRCSVLTAFHMYGVTVQSFAVRSITSNSVCPTGHARAAWRRRSTHLEITSGCEVPTVKHIAFRLYNHSSVRLSDSCSTSEDGGRFGLVPEYMLSMG